MTACAYLNVNVKEPRIFVNNVLQGRFQAAAHNTWRPLPLQFDRWDRRALRYRKSRRPAAAERRFRPDVVCLGGCRGPAYVVRPYPGAVDAAQRGRTDCGFVQYSRQPAASADDGHDRRAPQAWTQWISSAN